MKHHHRGYYVRPLIHAMVIVGLFRMTYHLRLGTDLIPGVQLPIPSISLVDLRRFAMLSSVLFVAWGFIKHLYTSDGPVFVRYRLLMKTWLYWVISISFVAFYGSDYIFPEGVSRLIIAWTSVMTVIAIFVTDVVRYHLMNLAQGYYIPRALYVINDPSRFAAIEHKLRRSQRFTTTQCSYEDFLQTDVDDIDDIDIVIMVGHYGRDEIQQSFEKVRLASKKFYHISENSFVDDVVYKPRTIGGVVAFEYKASTLDERQKIIKRGTDIIGSMIGLILLAPVMLVIAGLIRRDTAGPILYRQDRVGKSGKIFSFVKFRSMYVDDCVGDRYGGDKAAQREQELDRSDANVRDDILSKIKDDPRVTPVGRWLRKYSLDELPSLWLVLRGDMSLIGPRPHQPHEVDKYAAWHKRLFAIKPGITGYAQVYGRDNLTFDEEAKLDLLYIQNWTLLLDIVILLRTFAVVNKGQ